MSRRESDDWPSAGWGEAVDGALGVLWTVANCSEYAMGGVGASEESQGTGKEEGEFIVSPVEPCCVEL